MVSFHAMGMASTPVRGAMVQELIRRPSTTGLIRFEANAMMRTEKGETICECDSCGEEAASGTLEWTAFIRWLKDQGWKTRKDGEAWTHFCPECSED